METGPCGAHGEDCGGVPPSPTTLLPTGKVIIDNGNNDRQDLDEELTLNNGGLPVKAASTGVASSPFTQTPSSSGPNWVKIAGGVSIILVVDLLVVIPIVVGLTAFTPELEIAMVLTEAWSWPLVATAIAFNVHGWDLIVEGANGH